ncbi:efflux RND transporter periplasmic adaptor subunit [Pendulispora albinea]|uniref:Efflux RND transporter periplasmic adaptor subunit n=1 Tax=Pendulispora albinea TaxID=2741071 RepID=A0ABZ2LRH2_9BACT
MSDPSIGGTVNDSPIEKAPANPATGKRTGMGYWRVPIVLGSSVFVLLCSGGVLLARAAAHTNRVALASEPKGVTVVPAKEAKYRPTRRYVGTLEPWVQAKVGPQLVSAYVDTVLVRPGASVKRGDVLATLDCRSSATANRATSLQARALETRQRAMASETARMQSLLDGGFIAPNELEQKQAQTNAESDHLASLRAQLAGKELEVNDCILRAPFDGEVCTRAADPGVFVRPGSSIATVVDRHVIRLTADVPETDFDAVVPGTPVRIVLLATHAHLTGAIARRSPAADPATRTVHVEVDLDPRGAEIPVGTTAEIGLDVGQPAPALEIPLAAAKIRGDRASLVLVEQGAARTVTAPVLGESDRSLFIAPELHAGALVVTEGRAALSNGDRVLAKVDPGAS